MHSDSIFIKGDSHEVCQDYALSGGNFVVVSDGCSSSEDTDIGSRIVSLVAKTMLQAGRSFDKDGDDSPFRLLAEISFTQARNLGLPPTVLDCTVGVISTDGEKWSAQLLGDGAIMIKFNTGIASQFHYIEYEGNAPSYLSYLLPERGVTFLEMPNNQKYLKRHMLFADGEINPVITSPFETKILNISGDTKLVDWVAVLTDGFFSFSEPNQGNPKQRRYIPHSEYMKDFFNFKTFKGEFVKRRVNAFLKNKGKLGWEHYDDLSMGVVKF